MSRSARERRSRLIGALTIEPESRAVPEPPMAVPRVSLAEPEPEPEPAIVTATTPAESTGVQQSTLMKEPATYDPTSQYLFRDVLRSTLTDPSESNAVVEESWSSQLAVPLEMLNQAKWRISGLFNKRSEFRHRVRSYRKLATKNSNCDQRRFLPRLASPFGRNLFPCAPA
ncbi:hypothetical protein I7I50_09980 [Histoplasma capsulatum G186AR]|uniref:Uncharacterized protein n=1 Tax=Ajellomyces capsulatus TaxID=5037 RepID=A0A8H8D6B1_AJECA|nr:hypothetical protein I7I52_01218 [Histoplasma capsulatum]QSS68869.1 hypothetical protein I7I50_09980 [Histoplasma capsulatum G186AR]